MEQLSVAMQNYLETIFSLSKAGHGVRVSDVASHLGVSKASVNNAINVLADLGYVSREKYQEIYLTGLGKTTAELLEGNHSILKTLFVDVLGVSPEIADKDACAIEHIISKETIFKIRQHLSTSSHIRKKN